MSYNLTVNAAPTAPAPTPTVSLSPITSGGGGSAYDLSINGGARETSSENVTLSLYGTAAYTMEVSNTSTFSGASWIPYVTSMPWTLSSNPGTQTIYVEYKAVGGTIVGNAEASLDLLPAGTSLPASTSTTVTVLSTIVSTSSMAADLASLQAELAELESQATAPVHFTFTRNLSYGMTGSDINELQQFLIQENKGPAAEKLASHGTTTYFGSLTKAALIEFQKSAGIKPAAGFFGPITRAYVNGL